MSNCHHVNSVGVNTWDVIEKKKAVQTTCETCQSPEPNLWLCLHSRCLYVGCGESHEDHSSKHAEGTNHYLTLNLTTMRIWCYMCEMEVHKDHNRPPLVMGDETGPVSNHSTPQRYGFSQESTPLPTPDESDTDDELENIKPKGLTGLQNIGNTCYMNSALQALSNCPPLTRFFLDCGGFVRTDKKPMMSKSYQKLICQMWHKKRPSYVVPSSVAHGIKIVHPMFRGYTQQDTQEFLRCFMDQLHEELKQPIPVESLNDNHAEGKQEGPLKSAGPTNTKQSSSPLREGIGQSDTDYETCDSGMSSEQGSIKTNGSECGEAGDAINTGPGPNAGAFDKRSPPVPGKATPLITRNSSVDSKSIDSNAVNSDNESGLGSQQGQMPSSISAASPESCINDNDFSNDAESTSEQEPLNSQKATSLSAQRQSLRTRTASQRSRQSSGDVSPPPTNIRLTSAVSHLVPGQSKESKEKNSTQYQSIISDVFDGKILSSVQCLICERVSSTKEAFQDLSLPIPSKEQLVLLHSQHSALLAGNHKGTCGDVNLNQGWFVWMFGWMKNWFWGPQITLQDCLAAFFSADELKGDNMYSCDKCKKLRNGVKYSKVLALPEILSIHLKRFRHEFMFSTKISSNVEFPLENLDMGPYLHKDCKDSVTKYDLVAVICHHGTAGGGHYTAYALNYLNEQWYEYDDQCVTEVDSMAVENCEAYVLFYRKKNDIMIPQRQKAEQLIASPEASLMTFCVSKQWINKFNTFSEPGPITNSDFLCKHGGVPPTKWQQVNDLFVEMPRPVWEYLHDTYGGGPAVNHVYQCKHCEQEAEMLKKRQRQELQTFIQLNDDFHNDESSGPIYAISLAWFKEWENFVRGRTDTPPMSIDNSKIAMMKGGLCILRKNSDYGQLSDEMWQFLHGVYGGGPQMVIREAIVSTPTQQKTLASLASSQNPGKMNNPTTSPPAEYSKTSSSSKLDEATVEELSTGEKSDKTDAASTSPESLQAGKPAESIVNERGDPGADN